jgi:hypothetical protein
MKREATLHVVLDCDEDWPDDDVLKASLAGRVKGERLWSAYRSLPVTVAETVVVNLREAP